jgi:hypothetical protein
MAARGANPKHPISQWTSAQRREPPFPRPLSSGEPQAYAAIFATTVGTALKRSFLRHPGLAQAGEISGLE